MRRIIVDYYNEEYHIQFWSNGTIILVKKHSILDEIMLENFLTKGITNGQTISK